MLPGGARGFPPSLPYNTFPSCSVLQLCRLRAPFLPELCRFLLSGLPGPPSSLPGQRSSLTVCHHKPGQSQILMYLVDGAVEEKVSSEAEEIMFQ